MNTSNSEKEKILFWYEDPNILLNQTYILEFIPTHLMSYNQQLNAKNELKLSEKVKNQKGNIVRI